MIHPRITGRAWRNVVLFALITMIITTLPYLVGAASQREGWRFGWFMFGVTDGNSYLAKMREGAVDGWLFHIAYTSEPHDGAVLFVPYLAGGKLAALFVPPSSPAFVDVMLVIFHVSRIAFGILLILVMYRFIAAFLVKRSMRWLALILATFGGGLGWLLLILGQGNWLGSPPVELILPEGYSFYLLYGLPHLALARAAMLGGLLLTFRALSIDSRDWRWLMYSLLAGVCWLIMGLCVPFYIAVIYAVLGVWGLATLIRCHKFPVKLFARCVVGALVPLPYFLYNALVFATNPVMAQWSAQNTLYSPHPLHYVLGYGVLAILALPAIRWGWRRSRRRTAYLLLPAWIVAAPILVYLPINVQRRLLEGMFVPLCILAVMGLRLWWIGSGVGRFPRRARLIWREAVIALLVVSLASTLMLILGTALTARTPDPGNLLFHHSTAEIAVLDWLNTHAEPDSVVLCSFVVGNYLPARTSLRAFIGHGPETLRLGDKEQLVDRFFAGQMSADERRVLFEANHIRYIIVEPGMRVPDAPELSVLYNQDGYMVYEVENR